MEKFPQNCFILWGPIIVVYVHGSLTYTITLVSQVKRFYKPEPDNIFFWVHAILGFYYIRQHLQKYTLDYST